MFLIPGFHAVKESLIQAPGTLRRVWIGSSGTLRSGEIVRLAQEKGVALEFRRLDEIDALTPGANHQGFMAFGKAFSYIDLEDLIKRSHDEEGHALLVAADHLTDEGNLGALMRSAAFFGVHGVILPKDRSARITGKLLQRTSGAYVSLPVSRVTNLVRALDLLAEKGFWIIGAAGDSRESIYDFDWERDVVLILGSESRGLSRVVKERCHALVGIPGCGRVESLNVSVAGGVIFSEIVRQRKMRSK